MNKIQIKEMHDIIVQMNNNTSGKKSYYVKDGYAYFTPEGHKGYAVSYESLKQAVEDTPQSTNNTMMLDTFEGIRKINKLQISANELLKITRSHKKQMQAKKPFIIDYCGKLHGFNPVYIIDVLKLHGTKAEIFLTDEKYPKLYVTSELGKSIILPILLKSNIDYTDYTETAYVKAVI